MFDYGEVGDIAYIVMEYVDGPSVKSLVDKQERFAIADTMRIMTDLLNGLQFSHARGVVHRDIKPANVMLTSDGQAKIADFGIARIESSSMTQAGTVLGTPAYMSPEQFMGQVVDARTDIYSSGVLLYQLLTGERPFEGGMSAIMHKALNTDPPLPSQITVTCPPAFDGVVRKAMAKRPEDRFQSAVGVPGSVAGRGRRPAARGSGAGGGGRLGGDDGCRRSACVLPPSRRRHRRQLPVPRQLRPPPSPPRRIVLVAEGNHADRAGGLRERVRPPGVGARAGVLGAVHIRDDWREARGGAHRERAGPGEARDAHDGLGLGGAGDDDHGRSGGGCPTKQDSE